MKLSINGIMSIAHFEGVYLSTYADSAGILTIGIGHTASAGSPVPKPGMKISLAEAVELFRVDIAKYEKAVLDNVNVSLSQQEFDALVSWHFNTGRIDDSTLTRKLNKNDKKGAAAEFARWNKATIGGVKQALAGLTRRRAREADIFVSGDYGDEAITIAEKHGGPLRSVSRTEFKQLIGDLGEVEAASAPHPEEEFTDAELLTNPSTNALPARRPMQRDAVTRATLEKFKHLLPMERHNDAVYILAVRGYYTDTMGEEGANDRGLYDDAMFVISPDNVINFNANTDPSKHQSGIATLKTRQSVCYKPGLHGFKRKDGPYPAFRQNSSVTVLRDGSGEDTDSSNGYFWINLHRGGKNHTSSAGCQTIPVNQWPEFKSLVDALLKKHNQKDFYYLLVDEVDVVPETALVDVQSDVVQPSEVEMLIEELTGSSGGTTGQPEELQGHSLAAVLQALRSAKAAGSPTAGDNAELTPVNRALGQSIGKLLDGRKTWLGVAGLLLAVLIPQLNPELAKLIGMMIEQSAVSPDNGGSTTSTNAWLPVVSALTGWGVLGKVEKWVHILKNKQ